MTTKDSTLFGGNDPEKFTPIKPKKFLVRLTFAFIILSLFSILLYFFYFQKSDIKALEEETINAEFLEESIDKSDVHVETVVVEEIKPIVEHKPATIISVDNKENLFYIVVGSFIDKDLADDFAKKIVKDGKSVYIIASNRSLGFNYVALAKFISKSEAQNYIFQIKELYPKAWIYHY